MLPRLTFSLDQPEEVRFQITIPVFCWSFMASCSHFDFSNFSSSLAEGLSQTKQAMYVTIFLQLGQCLFELGIDLR